MKTTKVSLRKKAISKGRMSLYLDFYPPILSPKSDKMTRREFLGLYIYGKPKGTLERNHNKETVALAESVRAKRQLDLQNGHFGYKYEANKAKNFLDYFNLQAEKHASSIGNYKSWLSAIKRFKEFSPNGINFEDINIYFAEDYRSELSKIETLAINTKAAYFKKFKLALRQAFKEGYLQENIADRVDGLKEEETTKNFLILEEVKLLMETQTELPDVYRRAFFFSILTGLRFSDIQNLTWNQIQFSKTTGYTLSFKQKKTSSNEYMPISADAIYFAGESGELNSPVFPDLEYSSKNNLLLQKWADIAGINKKVTFHVGRHTFATMQLTYGTDIYTVSKLLGHKDLKNTQIYAKLTDSKKREAVNRINLLNDGK